MTKNISQKFGRWLFVVGVYAFSFMASPAYSNEYVFEEEVVKKPRLEAMVLLESLGFSYDVRRVDGCGRPDTVLGTIPAISVGSSVSLSETITLLVTTKSGLVKVPNVEGLTLSDATKKLQAECFAVGSEIYTPPGGPFGPCGEGMQEFRPDGGVIDKVIRTSPMKDAEVEWTSTVTVVRRGTGKYVVTRQPIKNGMMCP